jgi:hypothetical protein
MMLLQSGFRAVGILCSILWLGAGTDPPGSNILIRDSFTLPAGQTYSGDLIAVESHLTLEEGSTFEGNLILLGGTLQSAGRINGDVAALDSSIHFFSTAVLGGSVAALGEPPTVDEGAEVTGSIQSIRGFSLSAGNAPGAGRWDVGYEITVILFRMFLLSAVAILIALFLPTPEERVARTLIVRPAISLLIGLLTTMASAALFLLLVVTVCLAPIGLIGAAVVAVAILLGWTAMGHEIGGQLLGILGVKAHPAVTAGVGTAILTLLASAVGYVPFAGPILVLLVMSFGLGAVILTRFGGQQSTILPRESAPVTKSS